MALFESHEYYEERDKREDLVRKIAKDYINTKKYEVWVDEEVHHYDIGRYILCSEVSIASEEYVYALYSGDPHAEGYQEIGCIEIGELDGNPYPDIVDMFLYLAGDHSVNNKRVDVMFYSMDLIKERAIKLFERWARDTLADHGYDKLTPRVVENKKEFLK
jgi:hypothetical protein